MNSLAGVDGSVKACNIEGRAGVLRSSRATSNEDGEIAEMLRVHADSTVSSESPVSGVGHRISWSYITFPLSVGVADIWMIDYV